MRILRDPLGLQGLVHAVEARKRETHPWPVFFLTLLKFTFCQCLNSDNKEQQEENFSTPHKREAHACAICFHVFGF